MVRTTKMELLRALVSERLSAAAEEIFQIVERTVLEYEEEISLSKWVVDSHGTLVSRSHGAGWSTTLLFMKPIFFFMD